MDNCDLNAAQKNWKTQLDFEIKQAKMNNKPFKQPTFSLFLSSLSIQAMIAIGKLENPLTGKLETNLEQARFLIETLNLIKTKSKNNITDEEKKLLDNYITNLRLVYLECKKSLRE
ncbi:MAG: DUF1844 domain-containing protein [Candidatus Omnitrophica bacterium]|nr:DUF1844 domain-containing protein [Candidatus Omnitrophota bacterium]